MYATDRGIEEFETRRGDEQFAATYLADRTRVCVVSHPEFHSGPVRVAAALARDDSSDDD